MTLKEAKLLELGYLLYKNLKDHLDAGTIQCDICKDLVNEYKNIKEAIDAEIAHHGLTGE